WLTLQREHWLSLLDVSTARVQCQQPGCGHSFYRRIHVVQEAGRLLVLGSTCFEKRFGTALALGNAT
ncbi:MAG: hypothetical protein V4731_17530, partial [Pseudomonadota bacterium]